MNAQLPPIDSEIRDQLARRSAGRLPEGLLAEVTTALDRVAAPRPRLGWQPVRRAPRLALAGLGAALVAILAVAVAFPALTPAPAAPLAGYPADRPLTTAELGLLLGGPTLPTNKTLVVSATIDIRRDICGMNRYPTVGVIHGLEPMVCVMEGGLPPALTGTTATGIFALRYLGARSLGLLGEVTPASGTRTAFDVTADWPLAGKTFLVNGWLGADDLPAQCLATPAAGDVLNPNGSDCTYDDWLGQESTAPGIAADHAIVAGAPQPSYDPLSLRGNARHVEAGGMRIIDAIDPAAPVHGVFVVRSVTEGCAGDPPQSSRGCAAWRVLAKVDSVSLSAPKATPTTTYPSDRALTTAELAALLGGPALPTNTTVVASVTIDIKTDVCPMNRYPTIGVVEAMGSQVCVMGATLAARLAGATATGTFAFRYLAPGYLGLLGQVTPASASRLAFQVADDWPSSAGTFLVEGWLYDFDLAAGRLWQGGIQVGCPAVTPKPAGDPLDPNGTLGCDISWFSDGPNAGPTTLPDGQTVAPSQAKYVQAGGMAQIDSIPSDTAVHGVFVVTPATGQCLQAEGCGWRVLAKVADIAIPASSPRPVSPTPAPTSSPARPADAPLGVIEAGHYPFTEARLALLMAADPSHFANRVAIVQAPFGGGIVCGDATMAPSHFAQTPCVVLQNLIKSDGVWAIQIGSDGMFKVLGQVAPNPVSNSNGLVFDPAEAYAAWQSAGGGSQFYLIWGWLLAQTNPTSTSACDPSAPAAGSPCPPDDLVWLSGDGANHDLALKPGNYELPRAGEPVNGVYPPRQDLFLVQIAAGGSLSSVVAEFEVPTPAATPTPTGTASPPATPVVLPSGSGASPLGFLGSDNRPLTEGEFATLWGADPAHLSGRTVVVKGPVPTGFECWSAGAADAGMSPPPCHVAVLDGQIAADGDYWAVSVGADGKLAVVGNIAVPPNGYVFTLAQAQALASGGSAPSSGLMVVDAWLDWANDCDTLPTEAPGTVCGYSLLTSDLVDWMHMRSLWPSDSKVLAQYVQPDDAYWRFAAKNPGQGVHGLYLVHWTRTVAGATTAPTIQASLAAVAP